MRRRLFLATLATVLWIAVPVSAKQWRGITPLHSTRAEVEKLLGSAGNSDELSVYQTDTEAVSILFASGPPCGSNAENEWRVPKGTVVSITVAPKTIILLSALNIDLSKYQKLREPHHLNRIKYWNKEEGEAIAVSHDEVSSFTYFAAAKDFYLRCPGPRPAKPAPEREHYLQLDSYGKLLFRDEKARLDNFASWLQQRPRAKGYIIVYPSMRESLHNASARSKRAANYLVNVRGIEPKRLVRIRGGFKKHFVVELYIVPPGAEAPSPPTPSRCP